MAARADPRLDEKVYSPYVENHMVEFESRTGVETGGPLAGAATTLIEAEYGLNDRISVSLVGELSRDATGPLRFSGVAVEGVVYTGQIPGIGVDTGLYLEYSQGVQGGESAGEAKLLLAKTSGRFQGLFNLIVERPLAVPRGEGFATYGYAASVTWRTIGKLRLGAEAFGDLGSDRAFLGRQGAYVGPQVKWSVRPRHTPFEINVDVGWLAAVGTNRTEGDGQFRAALALERRF
jgi:hypothetical protein